MVFVSLFGICSRLNQPENGRRNRQGAEDAKDNAKTRKKDICSKEKKLKFYEFSWRSWRLGGSKGRFSNG
jgi:hypothetical protein